MDYAASAAREPEELVVYSADGAPRTVSLASGRVTLGRATANDLSYPDDSGLSRQHFIIERVGEELRLSDLGSKNGTELNGRRVTCPCALNPGDRIKAGRLTLEYRVGGRPSPDKTVLFVESETSEPSSGTIIATNLQSALGAQSASYSPSAPALSGQRPVDALIRAGQELAAHRPLAELFPLILDLSLQAVRASRGVLMTSSGGSLVVQAAQGENFQISTAVRDRVMGEKTSLLVVDALTDSQFAGRDSIVQQSVRSMIAAPLQTGDEVIGLLYVDLTNLTRTFTRDDLNLLTVMANIAAIRIQHAHLIEVEAAERIHTRELIQAADIQKRLLPTAPPEAAGLDLAGYNLQCRTVGGDYFDYLPCGEGKLALVVGDVAGKGMPAALLMASLQAHTQAIVEFGGGPASVVSKLNRAIVARSPDNRFVTFFMAAYDPDASVITYCSAGHNPPLLLRSDGRVERLEEGGLVLGVFAAARFEEKSAPFHPGDILVLYSDGVVEAPSAADDEEFGEERLAAIIREMSSLDLAQIIQRVVEALRAWSGAGGFADDVTIVLARRTEC